MNPSEQVFDDLEMPTVRDKPAESPEEDPLFHYDENSEPVKWLKSQIAKAELLSDLTLACRSPKAPKRIPSSDGKVMIGVGEQARLIEEILEWVRNNKATHDVKIAAILELASGITNGGGLNLRRKVKDILRKKF